MIFKHNKSIPRITIKSYPMLIITSIIFYITGYGMQYVIAFFSISIHEFFHIFCGASFNLKIHSIKVIPVGLNAEIDESNASSSQRIVMYLSGPFSNFIISIGTVFIHKNLNNLTYINSTNYIFTVFNDTLVTFYQINIYLIIFNLLPILPLDGGKIIFQIIAKQKGIQAANGYMRIISHILLSFIFSVGIIQSYLLLNFNILIISIYLIFLTKYTKWEAAFMNLKQLLYRRSRILKKGIYSVRSLVVLKTVSLGESLKSMDFDGFHIIYVLDESLKLIETITEQEVMEALIEYDNDITFEEFLKKKL